jgi:methyl-accepting chemotaxis protein
MAMGTAEDKFASLAATMNRCDALVRQSADISYAEAQGSYRRSLSLFIAILVIAIGLSTLLTLFLTRLLTRAIASLQNTLGRVATGNARLTEAAQGMAAGDTSIAVDVPKESVEIHQNNEIGALAESIRHIVESQEQLSVAFHKVTETLKGLVDETSRLSESAVEGRLSTRGDTAAFEGGYRQIVEGVNKTLDAVIGPLNIAAKNVQLISRGDIPPQVTDEYRGDFNEIKSNLNTCINAVEALVADTIMLSEAAVEGRLSTRADASRHQGDFRKIVEGINGTLDSVIRPVEEGPVVLGQMAQGDLTPRVKGDYHGDHRRIVESINAVADSLMKALLDVSEAVSATASASSQISSSTEQIAAGAQEQTSQTGEVAGAVEEMTKTILENSRNAGLTAETAKQARQSAETGWPGR